MNSIVQVILHNPILNKFLIEKKFENDLINNISSQSPTKIDNHLLIEKIKGTITFQLYNLLMNMKDCNIISPDSFKNLLSNKNETFKGFRQNDSHELLSFLLDTIHEETKSIVKPIYSKLPKEYHQLQDIKKHFSERIHSTSVKTEQLQYVDDYYNYEMAHQDEVLIHNAVSHWAKYLEKNYSVISEFFAGMFHSSLKCDTCGYLSSSFEIFTILSLDIPSNIDNPTIIDCFDLFCTQDRLDENNKFICDRCGNSTCGIKKLMLWYAPEILIIHFKRFKQNGRNCSKNTKTISYQETLDISKYVSRKSAGTEYKLISVVHHYGGLDGGHYVSFNNVDDYWIQFNDSSIAKIVGDIHKQIINENSYILIYKRR
jgi:ubiquitin C-terminal hydrolase